MSHPKYSIIVPVYNRPQELDELLFSLTQQEFKDFEVLIIEDGSSISSDTIFENYSQQLTIQYFFKPNSGPGPSRNYGFQKARGDFFIVFDSDCIIPSQYLKEIEQFINSNKTDAFGGPDRGHENFTPLQQAMAYTMSSVLTTGGIRGANPTDFQPRSFNMGISRKVFEQTGGFHFDHFAEDIELSIRMKKLGFQIHLIPNAFVYHKRRTSLSQFYRQVSNFGRGRILVGKRHRGAIKITHWLPAFFTLGLASILFSLIFFRPLGYLTISLYALYLLAIFLFATKETKSVRIGWLAIPSVLVQMIGYGTGFLRERFKFIT